MISADFADNVKVKYSIPCEKSDNIKNLIVNTPNGRFFAEKSARNIPRNGNFEIKEGKSKFSSIYKLNRGDVMSDVIRETHDENRNVKHCPKELAFPERAGAGKEMKTECPIRTSFSARP